MDDNYNEYEVSKREVAKTATSMLWKKLPLKAKLTIIGIIAGIVFVIIFLIVLITPLMSLGIINIEGVGSDISSSYNKYASLSFSYCNSINVDGELYELEDYVAGVIEAEVGDHLSTGVDEALKTQAILARTYALDATNGCKNPINSSSSSYSFDSSPSDQAKKIASDTSGLVLTDDDDLYMPKYEYTFCFGHDDCPDSVINEDGSYTVRYTILPKRDRKTITLSDSSYYDYIDFENVSAIDIIRLVSYQYAKEGMTYDEIMNIYSSSDTEILNSKNMLSGIVGTETGLDYIGTYTNLKTGKTYKNYKQYLYATDAFDFKGKDHLASVGCGTTSTAIILSGEDSSISPKSIYIDSGYAVGVYFGGGRYTHDYDSFSFCASWDNGWCRKTNSKTMIGNKDTREKLISNLSEGGTAVLFINYAADQCLINGESWTSSQHFFTALDYNPVDDTIYISNPGSNSDTKNGWIPLEYFNCVHVVYLLYPE